MKNHTTTLRTLLAAACLISPLAAIAQVPQMLNYQGRVASGDPPVNFDGNGQFKFALVDAAGTTTYWSNDGTVGNEPTAAVTLTVTKGLYSVLLGDTTLMDPLPATVFTNPDVRLRVWFDDGSNGFQLLTPDQRIAAVGYAMMAGGVAGNVITAANIADGAVTSSAMAENSVTAFSLAPGAVTSAAIANNAVTSASILNGSILAQDLSNLAAWKVGGNSGTFTTSFLGTTDNRSLNFRVNGERALRLEPTVWGEPNIIAGASTNTIASDLFGSAIGGGWENRILVSDDPVFESNSTIGGGFNNVIGAMSEHLEGFFFGGANLIAGGESNNIRGGATSSVIGGGLFNRISENADSAMIAGGKENIASGHFSSVPGGHLNDAGGQFSFAAGRRAKANHNGSFVWADSTNADLASTGVNQFLIRAAGGVGIGTPAPRQQLSVGAHLDLYSGSANSPTRPSIRASSSDNLILNAFGSGTLFFNNDGGSGGIRFHNGSGGAGNEMARFTGEGNLGIGTASPQTPLHVLTSTDNDSFLNAAILGRTTSTVDFHTVGVQGESTGSSGRGVYGSATHTTGTNYGVYGQTNSAAGYGGYFEGRGYFSQRLGVGIAPHASYRLALPNTASDAGRGIANGWVTYSSGRWKENVRTLEDPLDKVLALRGVRYDWTEQEETSSDIGFIAEEVGRILPEIVAYEAGGEHATAMDYSRLTPLLVEAIKEQQSQIAAQQSQIAALIARLESLESAAAD